VVAVFVVGAALPTPRLQGTAATTSLTVAAVQGGGVRGVPAVRADAGAVFDRHLAASAALDPAVELVLWPEDVVDLDVPLAAASEGVALSSLARELDAVVVVGVVTTDAGPDPAAAAIRRFRNQAVAIGPDGALGDVYDKVIRVPFGEYVPARDLLDRFVDLSLVPRDAVAGVGAGTLDTAVGRLGVAISFEGLFAERARAAVRAGARLLLVPTNAASYVTDDVPSQQVAAARLRAVETGRAVVLAAPTGPSAIVTADGSVRARPDLEERAVLTGDVSLRTGLTPYARAGDAPVVALAAVLLAVGWAAERRRLPWRRAA
jgi:apolipoprotein N-acyltransferase